MFESLKSTLLKMNTPSLILLSGVMGSGKSSLTNGLLQDKEITGHFGLTSDSVLSLDATRIELGGITQIPGLNVRYRINGWTDQGINIRSVKQVEYKLLENLNYDKSTILDGTYLKDQYRKEYFDLAGKYGFEFITIIVVASLENCLQRNNFRTFYVEPKIIKESFRKLNQKSKYPFFLYDNN